LKRHFQGRSRATRARSSLSLVYKKSFPTKTEALRFEKEIKKHKSKHYIGGLIKNSLGR
jgi:predicted GIY-YIG superfamily endonuclease